MWAFICCTVLLDGFLIDLGSSIIVLHIMLYSLFHTDLTNRPTKDGSTEPPSASRALDSIRPDRASTSTFRV